MSDDSPLFVSSLELLSHAIEIALEKKEKKYKFVILHLCNAIELLLKDCVVDHGISIYIENTNKTLSIWGCFKTLNELGVDIPERPIIELLIDDRNTIQHRFGYPNGEAVYYYLKKVVFFMQRFLDENYGVELYEALLSQDLVPEQIEFLGLVKDEYRFLDDVFDMSSEAAVIKAYSLIEQKTLEFLHPAPSPEKQKYPVYQFWRSSEFHGLMNFLEEKKFVKAGISDQFSELRDIRNRSAHSDIASLTENDLKKALNIAKEILSGLNKAEEVGFLPSSRDINEEDKGDKNGYAG